MKGTFHQVHGGVATNSKRADATPKIYADEYISIRGEAFFSALPKNLFILVGI